MKALFSAARWPLPSMMLALGAASADAEEAVLLASTAPGYAPGMISPMASRYRSLKGHGQYQDSYDVAHAPANPIRI